MKNGRKFLQSLEQRSSFLFVIFAAMSFANIVSEIRLIVDVVSLLAQKLSTIATIGDVFRILGDFIHRILAWWQGVVAFVASFFKLQVSDSIANIFSIVLFIAGRAFGTYRTADSDIQQHKKKAESFKTVFGTIYSRYARHLELVCDGTTKTTPLVLGKKSPNVLP